MFDFKKLSSYQWVSFNCQAGNHPVRIANLHCSSSLIKQTPEINSNYYVVNMLSDDKFQQIITSEYYLMMNNSLTAAYFVVLVYI